MFDILKDKYINIMLQMAKEKTNYAEIKTKLNDIDLKNLFDLCVEHELDGVVASKIIENDLHELPDYWKEKYRQEQSRLSFLKNKAADVCECMHKNDIKMIILKNGGIMADIMSDPAACPMEDIDSLVNKEDFKKAHEILIDNGFVFKFRSEYEFEKLDQAYRDGSTEYYIEMPDGEKMWFELAWRAIAGRWIRLDKEPDTKGLIENSYYANKTKVGILSSEDNLLQVCVHTAKHSYVRAPGLRLHLDVDRIVNYKDIDWDAFIKKVNDAHVRVAVYFSLYIPYMLFGTPIPEYVLNALKPKKRKEEKIIKILTKVSLLYPNKPKFTKMEFLRFQMSLYDSFKDMLVVLYPKNGKLKEIYQYKNSILTPYYVFLRGLDLVGIRKRKK